MNNGMTSTPALSWSLAAPGVAAPAPIDVAAELQDELNDLDTPTAGMQLRIKIPSGGGAAFEVETEEGMPRYLNALEGVIIYTHRTNAYWPGGTGATQGMAPTCSSPDGNTGYNSVTGAYSACASCPYNQFGSGVDRNGNPTRGKACKNTRRLYLYLSGDPHLYTLSVPPTSVNGVNQAISRMIATGTPYTGQIVRLTLDRTTGSGGTYSKVALKPIGVLPADTAAQTAALRRQLKGGLGGDTATPAPAPAQPAAASAPATQADDWTTFAEAEPIEDLGLPF